MHNRRHPPAPTPHPPTSQLHPAHVDPGLVDDLAGLQLAGSLKRVLGALKLLQRIAGVPVRRAGRGGQGRAGRAGRASWFGLSEQPARGGGTGKQHRKAAWRCRLCRAGIAPLLLVGRRQLVVQLHRPAGIRCCLHEVLQLVVDRGTPRQRLGRRLGVHRLRHRSGRVGPRWVREQPRWRPTRLLWPSFCLGSGPQAR